MPKMKYNKSASDHSNIEDDWINPKKCVPTTYFFKKCKNEEDNVKVDNKHDILIDECYNDEEEDDEMKNYEMKEEVTGIAVKRKDENNVTKETKSDGINNKIEKDYETACSKHKTLLENSALTEVMHEMLLSDLKSDFLTLKVHSEDEDFESEEKFYEEIDEKSKTIDKKHNVENVKSSYVGGYIWGKDVADVMTETTKTKELEVKKELRDKRKEDSELDDNLSVSESHSHSSDEESEYEHGHSFDKLFEG